MSRHHEHDDAHGATTIRAKGGGGGGKLVLGAVVAALLVGGGYYAWRTYAPQDGAQTAYNDAYSSPADEYADETLRGPIDTSDDTLADTASADESAAAPASLQARTTAPARRAAAQPEPVPEVTIGVTPINASPDELATTESEDLVVAAPRRPVWQRTPTARRLSAMYPERALERGREGEARLACIVQDGGALACEKLSETPGGFGNAALRVARTFRHSSTLSDGSAAAGSPVNLRVVFRINDEESQRFASR